MPKSKGKLKPEDALVLQKNYTFLLDELIAEELTPYLFQEGVIDLDDKDEIQSKPTRRGKVEELLKKIEYSGPNKSFSIFLTSLEESFSHVADRLRETDVSQLVVSEPYSWISEVPEVVMDTKLTQADSSLISVCIGQGWEHLFRRLDLRDTLVERERLSNPHASMSVIVTNLLIKWTQKMSKAATWKVLLNTLVGLSKDGSDCTIDWERLQEIVMKKV